jgi:trimeric autotransporter adhesin
MQAVNPPPDGGYPGGNTAEGQNALLGLTTGTYNTAVGVFSLLSFTNGKFNTGVGAGALLVNTADANTATGAGALFSHSTGNANTAVGTFALFSDTSGQVNTATAASALFSNTTGSDNTANGAQALSSNVDGNENTAVSLNALVNNTSGSNNVALGRSAGGQQTTGSNNVYIGFNPQGTAGESDTCYIATIFGQTSSGGIPVLINANHKLGTTTSSKRFKESIKPMDTDSEVVFSLKPVAFHYKKEIDPVGTSQFGLVAEDVEKVNPDLVVRDKEGKPYSVRYDQVNAMLLNKFLKEHRKVEEQEATIAQQRKDFEAATTELKKEMETLVARIRKQDSKIQRVSDQIELSKPTREVVARRP